MRNLFHHRLSSRPEAEGTKPEARNDHRASSIEHRASSLKQRIFPSAPLRLCASALFFLIIPAMAVCEEQPPIETADSSTAANDIIIVTAERRDTTLDQTAATVEIVDDEDLHTRGHPLHVHDALRRLPGIYVQQSGGGFGGTSDISIRGTRNPETAVLLDGIPYNDPAAPAGNPDFIFLSPAGLDRIEIVKGAQSGLYGSRAIGGVINLRSAQPTPEHHAYGRVEGGSYNTWRGDLGATGPITEHLGFAIGVDGVRSDGFSAQTTAGEHGDPDGHEKDGFERTGATGRLVAHNDLGQVYLGLSGVHLDQDLDFTGPDDEVNTQEVSGWRASSGAKMNTSQETSVEADVAYSVLDRKYPGETLFDQRYDTDDSYASVRGHWLALPDTILTLGVDGDWQHADIATASGADNFDRRARTVGGWLQADYALPQFEVNAVVRRDDHSRDGDATTFRLGAAVFVWERRSKLFSSVGTGFRAPSLYELYDQTFASGNPDLEPQKTTSYEIGHSTDLGEGFSLTNTAFRTEYRDAIVFDLVTFRNSNLPSDARIDGIENSLAFDDAGCPVDFRIAYTFQDSDDGDGNRLRFIPDHRFSFDATYRHRTAWLRGAVERVWSRDTGDITNPSLSPYALLSAAIGWEFVKGWEAYVRGENLTDEHYEYYPTYATSGAAAYLGVSASF
jgi:vitamin B12 transporter